MGEAGGGDAEGCGDVGAGGGGSGGGAVEGFEGGWEGGRGREGKGKSQLAKTKGIGSRMSQREEERNGEKERNEPVEEDEGSVDDASVSGRGLASGRV